MPYAGGQSLSELEYLYERSTDVDRQALQNILKEVQFNCFITMFVQYHANNIQLEPVIHMENKAITLLLPSAQRVHIKTGHFLTHPAEVCLIL